MAFPLSTCGSGPNGPMKVAVLWTQMGPYHYARLNALGANSEFAVWGLELCRREALREWNPPDSSRRFTPVCIHDGILEETRQSLLSAKVTRVLDRLMPDAVVTAGYSPRAMRAAARWAKKNRRKRVLMSVSTSADRRRFLFVEMAKGRWIRKNFDAAFVAGERSAAYLKGMGFPADHIWRGSNVVDNAHFAAGATRALRDAQSVREKYALPARYFLYVGRFSEVKNLPLLLRAYRAYRGKAGENPWDLVLAGAGELEGVLRGTAAAERIPGVHFAGFRQIDELPAYFGLASCLVHPSRSETWGLVVNEAMAAGLPVLVSDRCGCVPELVRSDRNGYVFDPADPGALSELMTLMATGRKDLAAMGEESRRIVSGFTPERWAGTLADCLRSTHGTKGL